MNQSEIKKLASEIIGDGKSPNMWFVTHGAYITTRETDEVDTQLLDGFSNEDSKTFGPFYTYDKAVEKYDELELDSIAGIGQVMIEDRLCGVIREKGLELKIVKRYTEYEYDDSELC